MGRICQYCGKETDSNMDLCQECQILNNQEIITKCDKCATWVNTSNNNCTECGYQLIKKQITPTPTTVIQPATIIYRDNQSINDVKKKNTHPALIALFIIAWIIIICFIVIAFTTNLLSDIFSPSCAEINDIEKSRKTPNSIVEVIKERPTLDAESTLTGCKITINCLDNYKQVTVTVNLLDENKKTIKSLQDTAKDLKNGEKFVIKFKFSLSELLNYDKYEYYVASYN